MHEAENQRAATNEVKSGNVRMFLFQTGDSLTRLNVQVKVRRLVLIVLWYQCKRRKEGGHAELNNHYNYRNKYGEVGKG